MLNRFKKINTLLSLLGSLCLVLFLTSSCADDEDSPSHVVGPAPAANLGSFSKCSKGTNLTYENFGEAYLISYCTSCHSTHLTGDARTGATEGVNFDVSSGIKTWRTEVMGNSLKDDDAMPPMFNVPTEERASFKIWMTCGAPGEYDDQLQ